MIPYPAVIVHGLDHAAAALSTQHPVALLSAHGAAAYGGAGWWRAIVAAARARHPATRMLDILDCADAPGRALEALRLGQTWLILDRDCPAFGAIAEVAAALGARVQSDRPPALDLTHRSAERQLAQWLATPRSGTAAAARLDLPPGRAAKSR